MNRPTKLKVGPLDYTLIWESVDWEVGAQRFGECSPNICEIRITERCSGYRLACIFAHEVAHALASMDGCYEQADAEEIADVASYSMVAFWRDNPDAFDWWISLVKGVTDGKS
jgi:hypothetical protein